MLGIQGVSVRASPALAALRRPGEDAPALLDAPPEQLLLRWLAHHLAAAGPAWHALCSSRVQVLCCGVTRCAMCAKNTFWLAS